MTLRKKIISSIGLCLVAGLLLWMGRQIVAKYHFSGLNRNVEVCLELQQAKKICRKYEYPLRNFLDRIRSIGVTSVVIKEQNVYSLIDEGRVIYITHSDYEKLRMFDVIAPYSAMRPETLCIKDKQLAKDIISVVGERTGITLQTRRLSGYHTIPAGGMDVIRDVGLGYNTEDITTAEQSGCTVLVKPYGNAGFWLPEKLPESVRGTLYEKALSETDLVYVETHGLKLPVFEFSNNNRLIESIRESLPFHAVRAHRIGYEGIGKPKKQLIQRWRKAAVERGCRLLYIDINEDENIDENLDYIRAVCGLLKKHGFVLANVDIERLAQSKLIAVKRVFVNMISLLVSVLMPVLSIGYVWRMQRSLGRRGMREVLAEFYIICGINSIAGIFLNTLSSNYQFYTQLYAFPYVKFTIVLPFVLIIPVFFNVQKLYTVLKKTIKVKDVLIGGVVFAVIAIVIIRSGNFPVLPVPDIEFKIRALLEDVFLYRPRFKEFMFGHPLLILGLWSRSKYLIMLGMVGQISIINTFMHAHTPLDISMIRTLYGIIMGSVLGAGFSLLGLSKIYFKNLMKTGKAKNK